MSTVINYPYTTPSNYTYDTDLIEVTGGVAKLKDLRPANATFNANYNVDEDGNWGDGVLTGTLTGATVHDGILDCTGGGSKKCVYTAVGNADFTQIGTVRCGLKFKYSGTPPSNYTMFAFAGPAEYNLIQLVHSSAGNIMAYIKDSAGATIATMYAAHSAVLDQIVEFEINTDSDNGAHRFFKGVLGGGVGSQVGSTDTTTATREASSSVYLGTNRVGAGNNDVEILYFQVFDSVQHVANYVPVGELTNTIYDISNPTIEVNSTFKSSKLLSFAETSTKTGSDEIKHVVPADGIDKWITGGSVATSNGIYSESNTATEMDDDAEEYLNTRASVGLKSFLHSDEGGTTPELDLIGITYDASLPTVVVTVREVEWIVQYGGARLTDEILKIRAHNTIWDTQGISEIRKWRNVGSTNAEGWIEFEIEENPTTGLLWELKIANGVYKFDIYNHAAGIIDLSTVDKIKVIDEDE